MTIKVGDKIPASKVRHMSKDGMREFTTDELFKGKKVVLFGLPGAFTPTCSAKHLPGFVQNADALKKKGVDSILCMSVNDAFVMDAWGKQQNVGDKVMLIADGSADFSKAMGLDVDRNSIGMGTRCHRFSMLVDDGVVKTMNLEAAGAFEVSNAETMLKQV